MTKFQIGISFIFFLGCSKISNGQNLLQKSEIYNSWIKSHPASYNCDTAIDQLSYDSVIEAQIKTTIESLRATGVDTLLILVNSHPGTLIADTCRASHYPAEVYVFWRLARKDSLKKNPDKCGLNEIITRCTPVFEFFSKNTDQLGREYIMPVILSARKQADQVIYDRIISSDIDEYVLYYSIHDHCRLFTFSKADITYKNSIFYSDNLKTKAYQWFVALEKECTKLKKK